MSVWTELGHIEHSVRYETIGTWRTRIMEAGQGPPLILMHGTGGHLEAYARNVANLAQRHRVIAYDFPGHGYTTHANHDLEISDYVNHLRQLMDELDVETAHLCGESLGGWVAIKYAASDPHRVSKLVLNTPGGTMATPAVMDKIRSLSQAAADDPTGQRVRDRLEWLMADPAAVTDELVELRQAIYSQPTFSKSMRHILCLQHSEIRRRNLVTAEDLAAVSAPAMVLWTSDDPSGPAAAGIEMARNMPLGGFRLVENAGHWPQWEQVDTYNQLMNEFLL